MSESKEMVSFIEDTKIIEQVDALALHEGTNRSAIFRRAIRKLLFSLSPIPTYENDPQKEAQEPTQ